jgi:translation elongation factor EF-Tu-like GTPase
MMIMKTTLVDLGLTIRSDLAFCQILEFTSKYNVRTMSKYDLELALIPIIAMHSTCDLSKQKEIVKNVLRLIESSTRKIQVPDYVTASARLGVVDTRFSFDRIFTKIENLMFNLLTNLKFG